MNDALVTGTLDSNTARARAYFVTVGYDNSPIWAGRPDPDEARAGRWSAVVPTGALAPGHHRLRMWAFVDPETAMLQLGRDVVLDVR